MNLRELLRWGLLCVLAAGPAFATTRAVPSQYPSIQAAIDAAVAGDEVVVADGIYHEKDITIADKAITVRSSGGPTRCIVDAGGAGRAFRIVNNRTITPVLEGFSIRNGNALSGVYSNPSGAGVLIDQASAEVRDCRITACRAFRGGAISMTGGPSLVHRCYIAGNQAYSEGYDQAYGGGIVTASASADTISHCVIENNNAYHYAGNGSASGGGVAVYYSSPQINNTVIAGNRVYGAQNVWGGGMWVRESSDGAGPVCRNTVILNNASVGGAWPAGGGVFSDSQGISTRYNGTFVNCILWGNTPNQWDSIWWRGTPYSMIGVYYSDVQGGWPAGAPYVGGSNISADPGIVGNYHIGPDSPCRDTGDPAGNYEGQTDIDGDPRVVGAGPDIGPDEYVVYPPVTTIGGTIAISPGRTVDIPGALVSVALPGLFYIQSDDRASGIMVSLADHGFSKGDRVAVAGVLKVNADAERFIEAASAVGAGAGAVRPFVMRGAYLGGADTADQDFFTGAGKRGVTGGRGVNNIGLPVSVFGKVAGVDAATPKLWVTVDDGSGVAVRVLLPPAATAPAIGQFVMAAGASSCYVSGDQLLPQVRAQEIPAF